MGKLRTKKTRYIWLIGIICVCVLLIALFYFHTRNLPARNTEEYNVILFAFDGLQAKHLHAYGYGLNTTPHLDAFLEQSYVFSNTVSPSSWTVPTFMSVFTSMYPSEHKLVNKFVVYDPANNTLIKSNLSQLSPHAITLAEVFKNAGYETAGFTGDAGISKGFGYGKGFDVYYDETMFGGFDDTIPRAIEWLNKTKNKKFFLFVHGYDVHGQHAPKDGFDYRYVHKPYTGKYTGSPEEQSALRELGLQNGYLSISEEDKAFWTAIYDEKINRADAEFDSFMQSVDQMNLSKNTIIVVFSDHGTEFFEHNRIDHGHTLYGELTNVLFAIKTPQQTQGKKIASLVSTLDLFPTVVKLTHVPNIAINQVKGIDLTPSFDGTDVSRPIFSETDYRLYVHKRSIQTPDDWKFIMDMNTHEKELYNLVKDPQEKFNVVTNYSQKAYELEQTLQRHMKEINDTGPYVLGCLPVYNDQCLIPKTQQSLPSEKRPNIVLINIDTLRADHIHYNGYEKNTTPFLDALSEKGVVFTQAITPSFLTFQTDSAIFSSKYPSQNKVMMFENTIDQTIDLMPKILHYYNYSTAAFVSPSLWKTFNFYQQFDTYELNTNIKNIEQTKVTVSEHMQNTEKPFFVFWHIYDAHLPYTYTGNNTALVQYNGSLKYISDRGLYSQISYKPIDTLQVHQADLDYANGVYDAGVSYVDDQLKLFFESIENESYYNNTLFIISSEHGEDLGEHGFIFHRDLYDVNIHVPLIFIYPGLKHQVINEPVSSLDILPTVLRFINATAYENAEGIDLIPTINGLRQDRMIFSERAPFDEYSVRTKEWKYILRNPDKKDQYLLDNEYDTMMLSILQYEELTGDELYNIVTDPYEQNNLINETIPVKETLRKEVLKFKDRMIIEKNHNPTPLIVQIQPYP